MQNVGRSVAVYMCFCGVRDDGGAGADATGASQRWFHASETIFKILWRSSEYSQEYIVLLVQCMPDKRYTYFPGPIQKPVTAHTY